MRHDSTRPGAEPTSLPPARRRWRALPLALVALGACDEGRLPLPAVRPELHVALAGHVLERGLLPTEYVLGKFESLDVVFVGEHGRIRHDVLLVHELITRLPGVGVYALGIEFASPVDQETIDRLLVADEYDDAVVRRTVKQHDPAWGYREYLDLFRAAWTVNRERPEGREAFRILALGGVDGETAAAIIRTEVLAHGGKALVYGSVRNSLTRFAPTSGGAAGPGRVISEEIGPRAGTILLHAPWPSRRGPDARWVYPADGHIDASLIGLSDENRRAGFDVTGSAFAELPGETSAWSVGREGFTLGDLCDGYVFQTALHLYEGVTPLEDWFDDEERTGELAAASDIRRRFARFH